MKKRKITYPKINMNKEYVKKCSVCDTIFTTSSANKQYCDVCKEKVSADKNNERVKKHNKLYKKEKFGTGKYLNDITPAPPDKELEYIISEMKYLQLL